MKNNNFAQELSLVLAHHGIHGRQNQLTQLVSQGLSNAEVANQMFISEKSVKYALTMIYKKLSLKSRAQLIVWCLRNVDSTVAMNYLLNHGGSMMSASYKTKKDLKAAVGQELKYVETSLFGEEYKPNGTFCVVGPSAYQRKWYAEITMKDGKIERVK